MRPISSSSRLPRGLAASSSSASAGAWLLALLALDDVDAHLGEHRHRVLDLLGGHLVGRQRGVQLVIGDVAALLAPRQHLLDRGGDQVSISGASAASSRVSFASAVFAALLAIPPPLQSKDLRAPQLGRRLKTSSRHPMRLARGSAAASRAAASSAASSSSASPFVQRQRTGAQTSPRRRILGQRVASRLGQLRRRRSCRNHSQGHAANPTHRVSMSALRGPNAGMRRPRAITDRPRSWRTQVALSA